MAVDTTQPRHPLRSVRGWALAGWAPLETRTMLGTILIIILILILIGAFRTGATAAAGDMGRRAGSSASS